MSRILVRAAINHQGFRAGEILSVDPSKRRVREFIDWEFLIPLNPGSLDGGEVERDSVQEDERGGPGDGAAGADASGDDGAGGAGAAGGESGEHGGVDQAEATGGSESDERSRPYPSIEIGVQPLRSDPDGVHGYV